MIIYPPTIPSLYRAFDVELLYIARYFNIPIAEVAVNWEEIEGTSIAFAMTLLIFIPF